MQVEHERNQGALETGGDSVEDVKTTPGQFNAAFEVDDIQSFGQFPMRQEIVNRSRDRALGSENRIISVADPDRYVGVRNIRDHRHDPGELGFHGFNLRVELGDPVGYAFHRRDSGFAFFGIPDLPDLFGRGVAVGFKRFDLAQDRPPFDVEFDSAIDWFAVHLPVFHCGFYEFRILTDQVHIQHFTSPPGVFRLFLK